MKKPRFERDETMEHRPFATAFDVALVFAVNWLALSFPGFVGGFGWFLLLALSPRAWR